ncbi:unnamed protein product, partial [Brassica rapa]
LFFLSLDLLGRSGSYPALFYPPSSFSALSELVLLFVFYLLKRTQMVRFLVLFLVE